MRALLVIAIVAIVSLGACGKGSSGAPEATDTKDLGKTGFVIDAPKSWKVTEDMENWFSLEDGRGKTQAQIRQSVMPMAPDVADLSARLCDGQKDIVADKLPGGGLFASCVGPSQAIQMEGKEFITTKVEVQIPTADGKSITCAWETDKPEQAKAVLAACKTIRKK